MELSGNSVDHLKFFIDKLNNNDPFAIVRPGDGEYMIIINKHFNTQDNWKFFGGSLTSDLKNSLMMASELENLYIGIPCAQCQGKHVEEWYINTFNLKKERTTYANIVCNENWKAFTNYLIDSKKAFYYVGPGKEATSKLNIIDRYLINDRQIEQWDTEKDTFVTNIEMWINNIITKNDLSEKSKVNNPVLFIFSAGPLTKILVPRLFQKYPKHQFFDCGSAIDYFVKTHSNRLYINDNQIYSHLICDFEKGHSYNNTR